MRNKKIIGIIAVVVIAGGWYAFRPERAFIDKTVSETLDLESAPDAAPVAIASGQFHTVAHETRGTATVLRTAEGGRTLRLTDFETSNGPDVRVYLIAAADADDSETVKQAGFIELAPLKGNIGDQNYDIPESVDLTKYRAVTIWCRRFGVNFGTAPLSGAAAASDMPAVTTDPLARGVFHTNAHETRGTAAIYQLPDGSRVLRLTDFETSNGPDVRVYLVAASDVQDNATVKRAGFVEVGALKGNKGDQNYAVPADIDFDKYRSVTIWCRRFGVNFGTAPLAITKS